MTTSGIAFIMYKIMRKTGSILSIALALAVFSCQTIIAPTAQCREISKAGQVFQNVKDGVVTIFSSNCSGSGFLADAAGLILTNSHVVKDASGHLRVRFCKNEVLMG